MVDTALVELLLRAGRDPSAENLAALRPMLADNVKGRGLFVTAEGADDFLAALEHPSTPVLAIAEFGDPTTGDATITVVGDLPPGLPISAVSLVLSVDNGQLTELLQEVVPAITEPDPNIDIGPAVSRTDRFSLPTRFAFQRGLCGRVRGTPPFI